MKTTKTPLGSGLLVLAVLALCFISSLLLLENFDIRSHTPMVFVFGVFLISWLTPGYFWGIFASLIGMFAVNFAFTYPYYAFNFFLTESFSSAAIMLTISTVTSALTTRLMKLEQLRSESEKEKMRANLLRAISHDLRTPLTSIYGSTTTVIENYDLLQKTQQLKLLEEVRADAEWLIRMVENLLTVTRMDGQDHTRITKIPTVPEELVDAALTKFHKQHPQQAVETTLPGEFVSVPMDPILIEQVLINLLENAVYHAKGMTRLELAVQLQGGKAVFSVADDGCGLPHDRLKALAQGRASGAEASGDRSRNNMGIGLSVCATIVRAHGGELQAQNRPGGGACFTFALDTEEPEDEQ